jgi:pimeloyl-ACP methyl ester carboxylesterase
MYGIKVKKGIAKANGINIAYECFGSPDCEAILLISGTGEQLIDWPFELIEELVQHGYRVVCFDNRDVGLSTIFKEAGYPDFRAIAEAMEKGEPAPIPYTLNDMADDAVGLMDALNIRKAHIAGASMGGAIAQLIAINHPEQVLSLTSIMADSGNPVLPVLAKPEAFASVPPLTPEMKMDDYIDYRVKTMQVLCSPGYPVEENTIREKVKRDVKRSFDIAGIVRQQTASFVGHYSNHKNGYRQEQLKCIKAPTVVLQGESDPIVALDSARDIAASIPGAELIIVSGWAHDLPVQLVPMIAGAIVTAARRLQ